MTDAFVAYPSTPAFAAFRKDYVFALKAAADGTAATRLPSRAKFLGTVKLHGTNATVVFRKNNKRAPQFQSRSRVIDAKTDNCGTVAHLSLAPLHELVGQILRVSGAKTFEEIMVAGEVAGVGIQKGVAIAHIPRLFAIFNIRIDGVWVDMRRYAAVSLPAHRIFNLAAWPTYEVEIDFTLATNDVNVRMMSLTDDVVRECPVGHALASEALQTKGKQPIIWAGEGIVWTLVESLEDGVGFDRSRLYNFKTKGKAFSTTAHAPKLLPSADAVAKAQAFAQYALAERRFEQGIEFVEEELALVGKKGESPYQFEMFSKFAKWVLEDAIREERYKMEEMGVDEKLAQYPQHILPYPPKAHDESGYPSFRDSQGFVLGPGRGAASLVCRSAEWDPNLYQDTTLQNVTSHYPQNDSVFFCRYTPRYHRAVDDAAYYCAYSYETGGLVVGSHDGACPSDATNHCTYPTRKRSNIGVVLRARTAVRSAARDVPAKDLHKRACPPVRARRTVSDFDDLED
ncbi:hypothetical protein AURDEDRAFT_151466 [Auricularia subglabra TFB-10046 SS5]|nr:hypothetical protein AURDEDRAFT_151466 [Auricularia subglabra TFB-10046 SS5]